MLASLPIFDTYFDAELLYCVEVLLPNSVAK